MATAPPAPASDRSLPTGRAARLVGLDVARCLALLGMVATHVLDGRPDPQGVGQHLEEWTQTLASGRASALFAVLAGVTMALVTGRETPLRGGDRLRASLGLAARALLVAGIGLVLGDWDSGIAVILTYYGVLFLLALPFLGLRAPALFTLAAGWAVVAPMVSLVVRPTLPPRGFRSPFPDQLSDPGPLLAELLFTGYYPAVPWLAYVLLGLAIGRLPLHRRAVAAWLAGVGAVLAVASRVLSDRLTAVADFTTAQLEEARYGQTPFEPSLDRLSGQPAPDPWSWLLVVAPHSSTPFDLVHTGGCALAVVGGCLLLADPRLLGRRGVRVLAVVFGAGAISLSLYVLHVGMRTDRVWPAEEPGTFGWHLLVLLGLGVAFALARRRGPLEWVVGLPGRLLRRSG